MQSFDKFTIKMCAQTCDGWTDRQTGQE